LLQNQLAWLAVADVMGAATRENGRRSCCYNELFSTLQSIELGRTLELLAEPLVRKFG
jgi:hypothetical protein